MARASAGGPTLFIPRVTATYSRFALLPPAQFPRALGSHPSPRFQIPALGCVGRHGRDVSLGG